VQIFDGVVEINEVDYGEDFANHPSIRVIHEQSDTTERASVFQLSIQKPSTNRTAPLGY